MKHVGDITKLDGAALEPVHVITFGSPCQDLSVAGKRAGLSGERSGLFMDAIRIIREMRDATDGNYPTFAIWENVPGAFSSNGGNDFGCVLEELARCCDRRVSIPRPPEGKWEKAGAVCGDGFSISWRTLDAQFCGVPQRRRRISVVMDFRGQRTAEILFERSSLRGNHKTGIQTGQGITGDTADCSGVSSYTLKIRGGVEYDKLGRKSGKGALIQKELSATLGQSQEQTLFQRVHCYNIGAFESNAMRSDNPNSGIYESEVCKTLDAKNCANPNCNQGGTAVVQKIPFTLHSFGEYKDCEISSTVQRRDYKSATDIVVYDCRGNGDGVIAPTLTGDHQNRVTDYSAIAVEFAPYWIVRRLTPLECERLQGYPDNWTDIGDWQDSKGRTHKAADTPRFRAIGNSIALPQWHWIMERMSAFLPSGAKLGSLFDGIGGFPLIWESLHGPNTARWASEIEEFPMAVTRYHFGEE